MTVEAFVSGAVCCFPQHSLLPASLGLYPGLHRKQSCERQEAPRGLRRQQALFRGLQWACGVLRSPSACVSGVALGEEWPFQRQWISCLGKDSYLVHSTHHLTTLWIVCLCLFSLFFLA